MWASHRELEAGRLMQCYGDRRQPSMADGRPERRAQIEEDTDRDRYMSPLEAKRYGIIDHIIGGDEAGFQARPRARPCWRALLLHSLRQT